MDSSHKLERMNSVNIFKIQYKDIILRDKIEADIDDYIIWNTAQTEWMNWDAPWEETTELNIEEYKKTQLKSIAMNKTHLKTRYHFEICFKDNTHIGWMNSYYIDKEKTMLALGIDIACITYRGKGLGKQAFQTFINYIFTNLPIDSIYAETWSGNIRMMHLATSCHFKEWKREKNSIEVNGVLYDGLTYKLDRSCAS